MKQHYVLATALATCLATFSIGTSAEENPEMPKESPAFQELDRNQDGAITQEEATNTWLAGAAFNEVDANRDGFITQSEYVVATS